MSIWVSIAAIAAATVALKGVGPALAGGRRPSPAITRTIEMFGPTLITALVVSNTFTHNQQLTIDYRAAGLAVGALALLLRAPLLLAITLAAATCATLPLVI